MFGRGFESLRLHKQQNLLLAGFVVLVQVWTLELAGKSAVSAKLCLQAGGL